MEPPAPAEYDNTLTVLGTSDLHSDLLGWDYYVDAESQAPSGLARIATLIRQYRQERPAGSVVLVDAGDTFQGNPLAGYHAERTDERHAVAVAMNSLEYAAAAVGNHDFNYGLDSLARFAGEVDFPLLAANVARDGDRAFPAWTLVPARVGGRDLQIGFVGVTTPGSAVWDREKVAELTFTDIVDAARVAAGQARDAGADLVIVLSHSGLGPSSSYGDALPLLENATSLIAQTVPGIDGIVLGHSHESVAATITNEQTGVEVPVLEPSFYGRQLAVLELDLDLSAARPQVVAARTELREASEVTKDPAIVELVADAHERVRTHIAAPAGVLEEPLEGHDATIAPSPMLDLVNQVQSRYLRERLRGTKWEGLPVLSAAAPYGRSQGLPHGPVSIRDIAAIYPFDNIVAARVLTGRDLRDYLEHAAAYFASSDGGSDPRTLCGAATTRAPHGTPDYNFDVLGTADGAVSYTIDVRRPLGERVSGLQVNGVPVEDDQRFVLGLSDYRAGGGGGYPHVRDTTPIEAGTQDIRSLVVDFVRSHSPLRRADLGRTDWTLVT
ncbi:bifunctional metallophosphatase/5'-nucleotidase [Epidermidibacterium keratini]|uniref:Bifunctional metallophosphatase/5'-nucleotidase n=1 Tax=Epidermidibacterium keratini TaxID=1891644 RepID=A0A7L4YSJ6_9ACTN|nr:5'-nucleotidase C-terminal domain-containing protein [Epidermidibacterium keratini]QHC01759.1 bifunctional metallophosphatase/5'-nucleotidase [Epidermidibacterium keratini]